MDFIFGVLLVYFICLLLIHIFLVVSFVFVEILDDGDDELADVVNIPF